MPKWCKTIIAILLLPVCAGAASALWMVLRKTGDGDGGHVAAWGETITYDFPRWFLREAWDPKQNFSTADVFRLSAGLRF